MTYSATITPSGTGTLRISVPAGAADDGAGNTSNASAHVDVSVDTEAPTPTITVPMTPQNGAFDATIDFGETVTGFVKADVTVGGTATHTVGALSGGTNGSYTLRITPTTSGTITIDVAANVATDGGSNSNNAATQATVTIDKDPPMPTITAPTTDQKDAFDVTIDFGEDVTGFVVGDLTVAGATKASNWKSGDAGPQTYTITLTPTAADGTEGTVTIDVNANVAMDAATNNNTAATQASVSIDKKRPTVMITGAPTAEQKSAFDLTITFNEDVTGFAADDLTVTGEATVTTVAAVGTSKTNYTATITPNAAKEGDVTVKVNANAATDEAGNGNIVSAATGNIHIDTIVPTVSVSGFPTAEQNAAYDLTVTFSEPVNGFAVPADLTLGLTREAGATPIAAAALKSGSDGDAVYTVTITPNAAGTEGDVTVTVDANSVQDFALNNNTASTETTSVHVDTIIPTVSVTGFPTIEKNVAYDLTVTFSEEVNGFAVPADLTVTGPVTASLASGSDGDIVYTVTITPNANDEGDVTVRVNASTVQDFARNDNTASPETDVVHVDTIPPTVSVAVTPPTVEAGGYTAAERNAPYLLTVTFSEEVNGFRKKSTIFGYPGTSRSRTS
ncbi:MAG: Ig-like domain-containing protein [Candidatus Poribacteria bacterium]|nr:Ig-like domain-containing protein [Candidatus Poribacteria bacterium]